jgi:3-methyladenine DNA glycosylase AlkD
MLHCGSLRTAIKRGAFRCALSTQQPTMTKVSGAVKTARDSLQKSVTIPVKFRGYFSRSGPGDYGEHDKFMGVTNPSVRAIAKECKEMQFSDLRQLLESPFNEERFLALVVLTERYKKADEKGAEEIYQFYVSNMRHVNNWNLVDTSAHLIVGPHLINKNRDILTAWASSDVLWERRIAMVATWHFIRNKDLASTFQLAEQLMNDQHDLMHKAVGWMLREAGKKDVNALLSFLEKHAAVMPRTMLRYSLEKLTTAQRKYFMGMKGKAEVKV